VTNLNFYWQIHGWIEIIKSVMEGEDCAHNPPPFRGGSKKISLKLWETLICKLRLHTLGVGGVQAWLQSPSKYLQEAVTNAEAYCLKRYNLKFAKKGSSPFPP
jgi:hypothetical protein